jgi:branched-chain amino acid aminotransferase
MKCIVNGNLWDEDKASIPATDLTLRRGYGLFDFFRVHDGIPLYFEHHLMRLFRGIDRLGLNVQWNKDEITEQVFRLIASNRIDGITGVRIVVTGGLSSDGFTPAAANVIVTQEKFSPPPHHLYSSGTALMTHEYRREIADVKSLNYMLAVFLAPEMKRRNTTEILYYSEGKVSECTRSNVFCIFGNKLITPLSDTLEGITRGRILEIGGPELDVEIRDISLSDLLKADEVFISSTIKRIIPVVRIDDHKIGNGTPGMATKKLMKKLSAHDSVYLNEFQKI